MGAFSGGTINGNILPNTTGQDLGSPTQQWDAYIQNLFMANFEDIRFVAQFSGASVGARIDAAVADLAGAQGVVWINSSLGAGWSLIGIPSNVTVIDARGNGGSTQTNFVRGVDFYNRITATNGGFSIPVNLLIEQDAYAGGVNEFPTGVGTKTQWRPIRIELTGRTIGERVGQENNVYTFGTGDSAGGMFSSFDWGGYGTGGDEGSEGVRASSVQGLGDGVVPVGTVSAVNGNTITGSWTSNTNNYLGELRPLINTSRGVYSTGTLASGSGTAPFTIVGSGTLWLSLGSGAVSDLFLEYTAFNGGARFVIPVLSIVDNTHLTAEYNINEVGASAFNPSGAYKIYKGGKVSTLASPPSGSLSPTAVNLAAGGSNFQAGDSIEQPFGYNYHGRGVQIVLKQILNTPSAGGGVYINNTGTPPYRDAYRASGNFDRGLLFDSGTISGNGVEFSNPVGLALLGSVDITGSTTNVVRVLNTGGTGARLIQYDRTNDYWNIAGGNNQYFSGSDQRTSQGTTPQASILNYMFYNNASWGGLHISPQVAPTSNGTAFAPLKVQVALVPTFAVEKDRVVINNGMNLIGFSDNETTQKWGVTGSTGDVLTSGTITQQTANGALWTKGSASELLTLSTSGTTTDTSANLLPANSIIEAVVARVTTTITTATDWKLGDATIAGRFSGVNAVMTAGSTQVGTVQADQTGTSGPRQVSAAKVRVTTTGTPGAGVIRITVFYRTFTPPTS